MLSIEGQICPLSIKFMYLTVVHSKPSPEVVPGAMVLGVLADPAIPRGTIFRSLTTMNDVDRGLYGFLCSKVPEGAQDSLSWIRGRATFRIVSTLGIA
jgi:hypothetical protein